MSADNMTPAEISRLEADREFNRLLRKNNNRRRYMRRYYRIGGQGTPLHRLMRVSDIAIVTIDCRQYACALHAYGTPAVFSDSLL